MMNRYQVLVRRKDPALLRRGLELHRRFDQGVLGGDPRVEYWTAPGMAAADEARRSALDQLLGSPDLPGDVWGETEREWARVGDGPGGLRYEIEAAVAIRDRVAAEALYLADWLCASAPHNGLEELLAAQPAAARTATSATAGTTPAPASTDPTSTGRTTAVERPSNGPGATVGTEADRLVVSRIGPLLSRMRALGESIDDRRRPATDSLPGFVATARELDAEWSKLKQIYLDAVTAAMARPAADASTLAELQNALGVPWLPAERRQQVTRKVDQWMAELHDAWTKAETEAEAKSELAYRPIDESDRRWQPDHRMTYWRPHPLSIVLGVEGADDAIRSASSVAERLAAIEKLQGACRGRLLALASPSLPEGVEAGTDPRIALARVERSVRIAATLAFSRPPDDPVRRLFGLDIQRLLLANARRRLDDFWGTAGGDPAVPTDTRAFFDIAVSDLLDAAKALAIPVGEVRTEIEEIERLLAARRAASRRGVTLRVEPGMVDSNSQDVAIDVVVEQGASAGSGDGDTGLPSSLGFVQVFARDVPPAMNTATFSVPLGARGAKAHLQGTVPDSAGSSFDAVAVVRGNEFPTPFLRPGFGGIVMQADFKPIDSAQVTLFGDRPQQSSVIFVLDCSASMSTEMPVELVDADRLPRLEIAKGALNALLEQLAVRADTRVGVRFFGHRVGWAKGELAKLMTQTSYSGPIPDDLAPSADVELILPLGRFDSVEAGIVSGRLRSVKPWGQSPLYLSLVDSIRDFAADRDDSEKSIVVITDGANYQFTPAGSGTTAPPHQTAEDVVTAESGKNVPVYILGFGTSDDRAAEREFTALAERTGGKFFAVENGRDLLRTLRERLGLGSYEIETAGSGTAAKSTKLNVPSSVTGISQGPATYAVRFQANSAEVTVEGGEALELYAAPTGRIGARPYDRHLPVEDLMLLEGTTQKLTVRAHRPKTSRKTAYFPVSLQAVDAPFTRRPDEVWIEITPVGGGRPDGRPRYVFYDRQFEPGTPVPVVPCTATDWPAEAKRANLAVWCKYGRSEPFQSLALSDVEDDPATFAAGVPIRNDASGRLRIQLPDGNRDGPAEIRVIEEHGADSRGLHLLKIMLEGIPLERVVRRFDDKRGLASHAFLVSQGAARRLRDARVTITARSAAHDGALHIEADRILTVDVGGSGDILPLDAATGVR
jgi:Mg-chelatase subunit ChlD